VTRRLCSLALAALVSFAFAASASAQATRTWVSGVGDDVNPCSRTAPCKTFAGAISKTAAGGEISVLDPGGFGAVTITKSITIDGNGAVSSILSAGTNGVVINAAATDTVILRNLSINGAGTGLNGIRILQAAAVQIVSCTIERFSAYGIDIQPTSHAQVSIVDTVVTQNVGATGGGVLVQPGPGALAALTVERSQLDRNRIGLLVADRGSAVVRGSTASANTNFGFLARSTSAQAELDLEDSVAANNTGAGIRSEGALALVRLSNVTTTGNAKGLLSVSGGQLLSYGNNRNSGNTIDNAPTGTIALQ
jgi:hypothetical protein